MESLNTLLILDLIPAGAERATVLFCLSTLFAHLKNACFLDYCRSFSGSSTVVWEQKRFVELCEFRIFYC